MLIGLSNKPRGCSEGALFQMLSLVPPNRARRPLERTALRFWLGGAGLTVFVPPSFVSAGDGLVRSGC